jgi:hypothetical protein
MGVGVLPPRFAAWLDDASPRILTRRFLDERCSGELLPVFRLLLF